MQQKRHNNRNNTRKGKWDKKDDRQVTGEKELVDERIAAAQDFDLSWFKPTSKQKDIILSMCTNDATIIQAASGCGKSTAVIWQALQDLRRGVYTNGIVYIKTAAESSDDSIGFLPNSADDKISVHMEAMRSIFRSFMSKEKLALEEKRGRIRFTIPNFIQGETLDNCLIVIEEAQTISPNIMKLLLERVGVNSRVVVVGDKYQRYSCKKRGDGLTNLIEMVTEIDDHGIRDSKEPLIGYVEMKAAENMRSAFSKRIVELYEEQLDNKS